MRQHIPLRLMAALILQSSTVPPSLSVLARPEQAGPQAAFNRLQARSNSALEHRSDAIEFFDDSIPPERQTWLDQLKMLCINDGASE